jgi:hypothetical protein
MSYPSYPGPAAGTGRTADRLAVAEALYWATLADPAAAEADRIDAAGLPGRPRPPRRGGGVSRRGGRT